MLDCARHARATSTADEARGDRKMGWSESFRAGANKGVNPLHPSSRDTASDREAHIAGEWAAWRAAQPQNSSSGFSTSSPTPMGGPISHGPVDSPFNILFAPVGVLCLIIGIIMAVYSAYDTLVNDRSVGEEAGIAFSTTYKISSALGDKIRSINPDSSIISFVNGARWVVGFCASMEAGAGAIVGSGIVWIGKELVYLATGYMTPEERRATQVKAAEHNRIEAYCRPVVDGERAVEARRETCVTTCERGQGARTLYCENQCGRAYPGRRRPDICAGF